MQFEILYLSSFIRFCAYFLDNKIHLNFFMTEYSRRATKLCSLFEALSTTPIGTMHDLAKLASFAYQIKSPFDADFNVNRPIQDFLKDVSVNVIHFMQQMKDRSSGRLQLPQGKDEYE